jgi:hypothetical protein
MPFYCKFHEDFEGLDSGKLHDHLEKEHSEVTLKDLREFMRENILFDEQRHSDQRMVVRTWGRPPKLSQFVMDSDIDKK